MNLEYENSQLNNKNPLSSIISDSTYNVLMNNGLINEKSLRNFLIKQKFKDLRFSKVSASAAIEILKKQYPYLQFDTIRKIVYQ